MNRLNRFVIVMGLLALAACNDGHQPPLPYAVMPRDAGLLSTIVEQASVEIAPPEGVAAPIGAALAAALAVALQEQDIVAVSGRKLSGAHLLRGTAGVENGVIHIDWSLLTPATQPLDSFSVQHAVPFDAKADTPLSPEVLRALSVQAATFLTTKLADKAVVHQENLRLFVPDIANAPGDGGKTLPLALRNALGASGLSIVAAQSSGVLRIEGQILLSELNAAEQLVKLSWRVLDPQGAEIGRIDQANPVTKGRLEGNWGEVAYSAAAGAAEGIIPLLQDFQAQKPPEGAEKPAPTP